MCGFIILHRTISNHWIWQNSDKLKWWIDILLTVNFTDVEKVNLGNEFYECKRGESLLSLNSWATRWGCSKDTARNFIKLLERDNMVKCVNMGKTTRLTVCNYEAYQSDLHVKQTQTKRKPKQYNKDNNDNNEIDIVNYDIEVFDFTGHKIENDHIAPILKTDFLRFLAMRKSIRKPFKSGDAIKTSFKKLRELSGGDVSTAKQIIDQSIAGEWQGLWPLKTK